MEIIEMENDIRQIDQMIQAMYEITKRKESYLKKELMQYRLRSYSNRVSNNGCIDLKKEALFESIIKGINYYKPQKSLVNTKLQKKEENYLIHNIGTDRNNYLKEWQLVITPKLGEYCEVILQLQKYIWINNLSVDILFSDGYKKQGLVLLIPNFNLIDNIIEYIFKTNLNQKLDENSFLIPSYLGFGLIKANKFKQQFLINISLLEEIFSNILATYFSDCEKNKVPVKAVTYEAFLFYANSYLKQMKEIVEKLTFKKKTLNQIERKSLKNNDGKSEIIVTLIEFKEKNYGIKLTWHEIYLIFKYAVSEFHVSYLGERVISEEANSKVYSLK